MTTLADTGLPDATAIMAASVRIAPLIWTTPVVELALPSGHPVFLKMECWQRTGSFKIRGALNKVLGLPRDALQRGLVTASAGNHGLGVALAAKIRGVTCTVLVPRGASPAKVAALRQLGAQVLFRGRDYDEAEAEALDLAAETGATFVHAFDDPEVIAGQGTTALELLRQLSGVTEILVPVGGGGLISGVASFVKSVKPDVRVVGVQPEASPAMLRALEAGRVVETPFTETLADGLAGRFVSERTLRACQAYVDDLVLVSETEIRAALRYLVDTLHTIAEGSAVVGLAALLRRRRIQGVAATIVTGRNIDTQSLRSVLENEHETS